MKNIPTAKVKEEMRRPTVENFQRLLDSLMSYNEVHATMLFIPKKEEILDPRRITVPVTKRPQTVVMQLHAKKHKAPLLLLYRRYQLDSNNGRLKEKKNEDKRKIRNECLCHASSISKVTF
uniref:Enzymatic polyprotein n=1 Tax=Tanacetum cinerariifolium TaxID=118510 RepID=A0A699JIH3_TANCI|nr:enzymatic polyprotein [Tanacetum cinerariifolium]